MYVKIIVASIGYSAACCSAQAATLDYEVINSVNIEAEGSLKFAFLHISDTGPFFIRPNPKYQLKYFQPSDEILEGYPYLTSAIGLSEGSIVIEERKYSNFNTVSTVSCSGILQYACFSKDLIVRDGSNERPVEIASLSRVGWKFGTYSQGGGSNISPAGFCSYGDDVGSWANSIGDFDYLGLYSRSEFSRFTINGTEYAANGSGGTDCWNGPNGGDFPDYRPAVVPLPAAFSSLSIALLMMLMAAWRGSRTMT